MRNIPRRVLSPGIALINKKARQAIWRAFFF
jgi:hypothetical protein